MLVRLYLSSHLEKESRSESEKSGSRQDALLHGLSEGTLAVSSDHSALSLTLRATDTRGRAKANIVRAALSPGQLIIARASWLISR